MQRPKTSSNRNKQKSDRTERNPQQPLFYLSEDLQTTQAKTDLLRQTLISDINHLRRGENIYKLQLNKHLFNTSKTRNRNISIQTQYPRDVPINLQASSCRIKTKVQSTNKINLNQFLNDSLQTHQIQSWYGQKITDKRYQKEREKNCSSENNNKVINNKNRHIQSENFHKLRNKLVKNRDYVKGLVFKELDIDVKNMSSFATRSMSLFPHSYLRLGKNKKQRQLKIKIQKDSQRSLGQLNTQRNINKTPITPSTPKSQQKISCKKLQIQISQNNSQKKGIQSPIIYTPKHLQIKSARNKTRYFQDPINRGKWLNYNKNYMKISKPYQICTNQPLKKQIDKIITLLNQQKQLKNNFMENL